MTKETVVLGIAGSIRNRAGIDDAVEGVDRNVSTGELVEGIEQLEHRDIYHEEFLGEIKPYIRDLTEGNEQVLTNSDALTLTALYGATGTADVEFHKLTSYLGLDESYADINVDRDRMAPLADALERADGLVLGTPVYFGDRSSLMHTFLNFAAERDLLEGKVIGTVSCGSKRNGGQETTNVYALFESLDHGAYIVGNGPKTCQYGGTGWGGDIGDVATDDFGLETSMGTGLRVSNVAGLRNTARSVGESQVTEATPDPFTVGVLITRDKDGTVRSSVERTISQIDTAGDVEFNIVDFTGSYVQACIGCDVCPTPAKVEDVTGDGKDYKCIIDDDLDEERWTEDDLQDLHSELMGNDALVVAAYDGDESGIEDTYQTLLERTRYIRRDDWRLHNLPLAAYVVRTPAKSSTYPMKIMTSWMRHNTIVNPPIVHTTVDAEDTPLDAETAADLEAHYNEAAIERFADFVGRARCLRAAAELSGADELSYKATGYRNKILDQTVSSRT
jgi:multimeric flavodoxin WrbA